MIKIFQFPFWGLCFLSQQTKYKICVHHTIDIGENSQAFPHFDPLFFNQRDNWDLNWNSVTGDSRTSKKSYRLVIEIEKE